MGWIIFSILAAVIWAIGNIIDKYVIDKIAKKPIVPIMVLGMIGIISGIMVLSIHGFNELSYINMSLAFIAGTLYILSILLYFRAAKIEEISRVIPLWSLPSLFVLILAVIFLGEIFTPLKYLGIFLIISGAVMITLRRPVKINLGKPFLLMIIASFLLAINYVITKYLLGFADYWTIFAYTRIGMIFPLIPITCFNFKHLVSTAIEHGKKGIALMMFTETLSIIALFLVTIAFSIGYVTLVGALSTTSPFFVLLFAVILSRFYPRILKEEIKKSTVLLKLIAIIMMFIGVVIII